MILRSDTVKDENGLPVPGASVYVYDITGADAVLTSDGTASLAQPIVTDEFGGYSYYADTGYYSEDIWYGGRRRWREHNIAIGNPGSDLALRSDIAATGGAALIGEASGSTVQAQLTKLLGTDLGIVANGNVAGLTISRPFTGNAGGATAFYGVQSEVLAQGSNAIDFARNSYLGAKAIGTGVVANLEVIHAYGWNAPGSTTTASKIFTAHTRVDAGASITGEVNHFRVASTTIDPTGSINRVASLSFGQLGHATRVLEVYAIDIADQLAASVAVGVRSTISAGTGKFNLYCNGTAANVLAGGLTIGSTANPNDILDVYGNVSLVGTGRVVKIDGQTVLQGRQAAIAMPSGGTTVDTQARTAIAALYAMLQTHGLVS